MTTFKQASERAREVARTTGKAVKLSKDSVSGHWAVEGDHYLRSRYVITHTELENVGIDDRGIEDMPDYIPEPLEDMCDYSESGHSANYAALGGWGVGSIGDSADCDVHSIEMEQVDWSDGFDDFDGESWEGYFGE